jgi:hypothetical protein
MSEAYGSERYAKLDGSDSVASRSAWSDSNYEDEEDANERVST